MTGNHLVTTVGVYALIIEDEKVLFVHQPNNPLWTALGGRMDNNDKSCEDALIREVKEELSIDIKIIEITETLIWFVNGEKRLGLFYICEREDREQEIKLSEEHDKFKFFPYEEGVEMFSKEERGKPGIELLKKLKEKNYI